MTTDPHLLSADDLVDRMGTRPKDRSRAHGRIRFQLYRARLIWAETGTWPSGTIPEPVNERERREQARVDPGARFPAPVWDEGDPSVVAYLAAGVRAGWWDRTVFAAALGITPAQVSDRLKKARRAEAATGVWPASGIPRPDVDRDGPGGPARPRWNPSRPDVKAAVTAAHSGATDRLGDPAWLRAQHLPPPDGLDRSVRDITATLGLAPGSQRLVRDALRTHGITRPAPARAAQTKPARPERDARLLADRHAQADLAAEILASGMPLEPVQEAVLRGRVAHPEMPQRALAGELGLPLGSLSGAWSKVLAKWREWPGRQ